jgi:hypothetical protein
MICYVHLLIPASVPNQFCSQREMAFSIEHLEQ